MTHCPLCGTSVALLRTPESRSPDERRRARIARLRERAAQLERGELSPGRLKEDALWMCGACQGIMIAGARLEEHEVRRRINQEVRALERRDRRAS